MGKAIGIDLGTTNSCVAAMEGSEVVIIPNAEGGRTTPSIVAFTKNGERLIGEAAKRQAAVNSDGTIASIKREMGTDYRVKQGGKKYSPQEISAMILSKLKKDAEAYLGCEVNDAVITVPAYFNDAQRQATKDAGRIAGLNVQRIINEPTAAAFAYGLENGMQQKILVYDLGGGTFDVSIIEIGDNLIEVLATAGDNCLGGDDFDERIVNYLVNEFKKKEKIDLRRDITAMQRVREEAEKAKITLSAASSVNVNIPYLSMAKGEPHHMDETLTRAKFEELVSDLVDRTAGPVQNALEGAGLRASQLNRVLLVGGSTRIPAVQQKVRQLTGMEASKNMNPDECVAMGAAIQAEKLSGQLIVGSNAADIILMDVTPLSLSIETVGGVATRIIERNTTIPARHSQVFTTAGNFQTSVDIKVLQGERRFARDNKLLGNFRLDGIKRALAGVPQIEVTFEIDANGIVTVSAKDLGTGKAQSITITSRSNMSDEEIEQAIRDAKEYEARDGQQKEYVDIRMEAENYLNQATNQLTNGKKTSEKADYKQAKADCAELKKRIYKCTPEKMTAVEAGEIQTAKEQLEASMAKIH